jgi:hypothetical protein
MPLPTITPTPEQIRMAELNGWDPQETAVTSWRSSRVHELTRKNPKAALLRRVLDGGTQGAHHPSTWTKQELAAEVEHLEWIRMERDGQQA